jgi:hypothetical protein
MTVAPVATIGYQSPLRRRQRKNNTGNFVDAGKELSRDDSRRANQHGS